MLPVGGERGASCLDSGLWTLDRPTPSFAASPVVLVVITDAAAAWPAVRHGWLRLLLPHGRRLPVPEGRRRKISPRPPHPRADTAPNRWGRVAAAISVEGGGDEQVRCAVRGRRVAGNSGGGIRAEANYGSASSVVLELVVNCCCILCHMHYSFRVVREDQEARHISHDKLRTV